MFLFLPEPPDVVLVGGGVVVGGGSLFGGSVVAFQNGDVVLIDRSL